MLIQLPGILDRFFKARAQARSEIAQVSFERLKVELPSRRPVLHRVNNEVQFESTVSAVVLIFGDLVCASRAKHCDSLLVQDFQITLRRRAPISSYGRAPEPSSASPSGNWRG